MKCEKCQDKGFTEQEHGLIMVLCDCDKAREVAESSGIPWREEAESEGESLSDVAAEANAFANALMPHLEGEKELEGIEYVSDSDSGTEPDNPDIGSTDTSQPKLTRKPKAKKKARARAG